MKKLENFLKNCTTELDTYNMDECISMLSHREDGEICRIDHKNSRTICKASIWYGEKEHNLTEKEIDYIVNYLHRATEDELSQWNANYNDDYDVRSEQGLFGYGY